MSVDRERLRLCVDKTVCNLLIKKLEKYLLRLLITEILIHLSYFIANFRERYVEEFPVDPNESTANEQLDQDRIF